MSSTIIGAPSHDDAIVQAAYQHVAEGLRRALAVDGLPDAEVDSLRSMYAAATEIAGEAVRNA